MTETNKKVKRTEETTSKDSAGSDFNDLLCKIGKQKKKLNKRFNSAYYYSNKHDSDVDSGKYLAFCWVEKQIKKVA